MADSHERFDQEISIKGLVYFGIGLVGVTIVAFVASYLIYRGLVARSVAADPAPPPIVDEHVNAEPPLPRLQREPEVELREMRTEDAAHLATYGWVDREAALARVPIERAIELLLEEGLEVRPQPAAEEEP